MIPISAEQLASAVAGRLVGGDGARRLDRVAIDSRRVSCGTCFFAIVGERLDGHEYLAQAREAGAAALVVHRRTDRRRLGDIAVVRVEDTTAALQALAAHVRRHVGPRLVAITGCMGKTTTKNLAAALLSTRWRVHSTPGNLNNHWGLPLSLLGLQPEHQVMVAEMAMSHAGEIRELAELAHPDIGLITNIAPVHMENFADLEAVAAAKAELADTLPAEGTLIVNADDPYTAAMAGRYSASLSSIITFGRGPDADVRAADVEPDETGWNLTLVLPGEPSSPVHLEMPGQHSIANFLAAAAAAHAFEVPAERIAAQAPQLALPHNRGQVRRLEGGITLIDDSYNASPVAMMRALDTLANQPAVGRRILVAGDMLELGSWTERSHREVGAYAAGLGIDVLVAVGDHAGLTAEGAAAAGLEAKAIYCFASAQRAGAALAECAEAGDVVLVKGSRAVGMERVVESLMAAEAVADRVAEG